MKKTVLILLAALFLGCGGPNIPKWYQNPPKDTALSFLDIGEGYSNQNAINSALNSIASRIYVNLSSTYVINKGIYNNKTYNDIYREIKAQVPHIDFSGYKILKSQKIGDKYYVLVKVDKNKLINNLKIKISQALNVTFSDNPAQKVVDAYKTLHTLKKIKLYVLILNSLNQDVSEYLNKITALEKKARYIIKNVSFVIKADKFKQINQALFSRYLNITPNAKNVILIKTDLQKEKLFNNYVIVVNAYIKFNKKYIIKTLGKSDISYEFAKANAKINYQKKLSSLLKEIFSQN